MKKLLNTLYVTSEDAYATLDSNNIVLKNGKNEIGRFPLHIFENIVLFTYSGSSPALMGACCKQGIGLAFCTPGGKFLARVSGNSIGNVLLRKEQYRISDNEVDSIAIARNFIFGKIVNARNVLDRTKRDHGERINSVLFNKIENNLRELAIEAINAEAMDQLRGVEGTAASQYFSLFNEMILSDKAEFYFSGRSRRPPLDKTNAVLSFVYSLLTNECTSAIEAVGLDSFVGFMHSDRPGRRSLALDLVEELRPCMADRFVLTMINNRIIQPNDFDEQESGAVFLNDAGRKKVIKEWQNHKKEKIKHPYLNEKIEWGLIPYVQSQLLSRMIRSDIDGYPPFIWR